MQDLTGKVAFITGAASGIGLGMARAFVGAGMRTVVTDIEPAALDSARAELSRAGGETMALRLDVSDREQFARAADAAEARFGKVHIVCNNAGVAAGGPIDTLSYADWDWVLGVNLHGVINGMMTFIERIKAHGEGGHIVNTSSILGHLTQPGTAIYSSTKFAVLAMSEIARADLEPHGIGVSALCPGLINTGIIRSYRNRPNHLVSEKAQRSEEQIRAAQARFAQGMHPDRVGEMVLEGIRTNRALIFTHRGLRDSIERRLRAVLDAFEGVPE
jgi:NAD(P)-dependent dehydrogenase (short-subunit alcohol dehydrogenase family)